MIAITLSLVLTLGVIEIFSSSKQTNRTQSALGNLQENARFALDLLSYDIRMAGNIGCNRTATVTNIKANTNLDDIGNGIQGYEYHDSIDTLPAKLLIDDSSSISKNPGDANVVKGTDTIVIRYASPNTLDVASATANSVTLSVASTISTGDPLIISDCTSADIFIANNDVGVDKTINLATGQTFSKIYGSDAEVAPLKYAAYYIRKFRGDDHITRNNLYRSVVTKRDILDKDNIDPDPLLEGVEDMQILYGDDLNGDGSSIRYVSADYAPPVGSTEKPLDMSRVTSIRLSMLFSTIDNNLATGTQNYWFNGELKSKESSDKKLYRGFTTTIKLRNKGL